MRLIFVAFLGVLAVIEAQKPGICKASSIPSCAISCHSDNDCEGSWKCCRTGCGGAYCQEPELESPEEPTAEPEKPGVCKAPSGIGSCAISCDDDTDCYGSRKCCLTACGGTSCQEPESPSQVQRSKPGTCGPPGEFGICAMMCNGDDSCPGDQKCCRTACGGTVCDNPQPPTSSQRNKPGSCKPRTGPGICAFTCDGDESCPGNQKCCHTGCGGTICSEPTFLNRVKRSKSGRCPSKPSGPWVCTDMCSDDSECRGYQKCCKNRCGALACQKPE